MFLRASIVFLLFVSTITTNPQEVKWIIYFDQQKTFEYFYKAANIWGLTGNVFFLNSTVIIDYKNKLFGVL